MAVDERKRRILVVETDADASNVIRYHLTKAGFDIQDASEAGEAVSSFRDGPIDLVVCDSTKPEIDGFALRKKLFLDPQTRDIPFLLIAPAEKKNGTGNILRNGMDEYVVTPFDPLLLVARVQSLITRHEAHHELMRIDPLTRILNRTTIAQEVDDDLARLERYQRFGCFALLNLDDLGHVNERHGVASGDLLLACLASLIAATIRCTDMVGRYDGDTFLLYLPETHRPGAVLLIERLIDRFQEGSDALLGEAVSFSSGIVEAPHGGTDLATLCARATEALHSAKDAGKAKVCLWEEHVVES